MYKLLRPHHAIFLGDEEQFYERFIQLCEENPHITMLFGTNVQSDLLFQWRIAFNTWIYFQTPEEQILENSERVMFYPTVQYIVQYFRQNKTVIVFKNNYSNIEQLVFIATLFLVNECLIWYKNLQFGNHVTSDYAEILMETDFYQIFQSAHVVEGQPIPKVLVQSIAAVFKDFKQKIQEHEDDLIDTLYAAISEAKKMHNFFEEVG